MKFQIIPENQKTFQRVILFSGFVLTGIIGFIDYLTGYEFAFSVFYVIPIAIVTWQTSLSLGVVTSLLGALLWLGVDMALAHPYSHNFVPIWNAFIRLSFFLIITVLLSKLRKSLRREKELASVDNLTGAFNSRMFYELVQIEINHFKRYKAPFALVYIDLDNFKSVNDNFGHSAGDQLLQRVVSCFRKYLRKTDIIARLGGDEFALLLPETNEESSYILLSKLQIELLEEMKKCNWPVTFSVGVVICLKAPDTVQDLMKMSDELMYSVKKSTKNANKYFTYTDEHIGPDNLASLSNDKRF
jgi:diguanylate cyclase (GGDEF)-like protein